MTRGEVLEVILERKSGIDCGKKIADAFWITGPESNDTWKSEPDPDTSYSMSRLAVFYREPSNDCFLLMNREIWSPAAAKIFGAAKENPDGILYEEAKKYAERISRRHKVPLRNLAKMKGGEEK